MRLQHAMAVAIGLCLPTVQARPQSPEELDPSQIRERINAARHKQSLGVDLPIVSGGAASGEVTASRRVRSRSFNKSSGPPLEALAARVREPVIDIVSDVNLLGEVPPALPFAQSDAVVRGVVLAARAVLSEDQRTVYSEFDLDVNEVFTLRTGQKLEVGTQLVLLRHGGAVTFPTGTVRIRQADQTMPRVGGEYVLFLKRHDAAETAYLILTGYGVGGGIVAALDIKARSVAWDDRSASDLFRALYEFRP